MRVKSETYLEFEGGKRIKVNPLKPYEVDRRVGKVVDFGGEQLSIAEDGVFRGDLPRPKAVVRVTTAPKVLTVKGIFETK